MSDELIVDRRTSASVSLQPSFMDRSGWVMPVLLGGAVLLAMLLSLCIGAYPLPFLKAAKEVIVLVVDPHTSANGHGPEPGADIATWLSRHGVKVAVQRDVAPDTDVGNVILSRAADHGADLMVMGVYGHSRLREMVLGGVSRTVLSSMTVPVLMSH